MRVLKNKWYTYLIVDIIIGVVLTLIMRLYAPHWNYLQDYFYISAVLLFAIGWFVLIINEGIFDLAIYGIQQFGKMLVGMRMKKTFEAYRAERVMINRKVYLIFWLTSLLFFLTGFIVSII